MSTYTKDLKKAEKAFKLKMKQSKIEMYERWEHETKQKEKMFFLLLNEEKLENERKQNEIDNRIRKVDALLFDQGSKLPYKLWLTLYDYLTVDYVQIESDINRGKISIDEYEQIKQIAATL